MVDDDEVGNAGPSIPSPGLAALAAEGSEQPGQNHDDIGNNCDQDIGTTQTSQKRQVEQEKWGGDGPVNVAGIVDLSLVGLICVWNLLMVNGLSVCVVADAITSSHGKVRDECKGGNEGSEDMEEAFLLGAVSKRLLAQCRQGFTYHRYTESHAIEGERGEAHKDDNNPEERLSVTRSVWSVGSEDIPERSPAHITGLDRDDGVWNHGGNGSHRRGGSHRLEHVWMHDHADDGPRGRREDKFTRCAECNVGRVDAVEGRWSD